MEIIVIIVSIIVFLSLFKSNSEEDIDRTVPQDSDD